MTELTKSQSGSRFGEVHRKSDVLLGGQRRHEVVSLEDETDGVAAQDRQLLLAQGAEFDVADEDLTGR